MRKFLCVALLFFCFSSLMAQKYKAVLPYERLGGKMIVEVEINGLKKRAIFDIGAAKNTITEELMKELGLKITSTQVITDVNSNKAEYRKSVIQSLKLPNSELDFRGFDVLVIKDLPFHCFNAEMMLGSEMFANMIVVIDSKQKQITVTSAENQPNISLRNSIGFIRNGFMPIISVDLENNSIATLFDTGYGGFFSLKQEDYLDNVNSLKTISESIKEGDFGLSGKGKSTVAHRVEINKLNFILTKFHGAVVETSDAPFSLIGTRILDYGKVTIDYPRMRLYFEPFAKEVQMEKPLNDYGLVVQDGKLLVTTVWSSNRDGIQCGDTVTHINGKVATEFDFCKSITVGIPQLKEKKKNSITINGKKRINYYHKK